MSNRIFFGILVLAAGILAGLYVFRGNPPTFEKMTGQEEMQTPSRAPIGNETPVDFEESASGAAMEKGGVDARTVVTYTDTGFSPSPATVKAGSTVTFVNESTRGMWVASAVHPTHQLLPGFDQLASVAKGGMYEYTFTKVGTWKYHNHVNPVDSASIVVTE